MLNKQQLAERKSGIGGSEMAAALGLSPWCTPLKLYKIKTGEIPADDLSDNEIVHFGNVLEDVVAQEWSRRTGLAVRRDQRTWRAANDPWMLGHIDRRVTGKNEGLECKTASFRVAQKWGAGIKLEDDDFSEDNDGDGIPDEMPIEYLIQNHTYLALTGFDAWHTAVLIAGNDFRMYRVDRDVEMIQQITDQGREFWRRIELKSPPPPMTEDDCKLLWPSHVVGRRTIALPNVIKAIEDAKVIRERMSADKKALEPYRLAIKVAIGDAEELIDPEGKPLITFKKSKDGVEFDEVGFGIKQPVLWKEFQKTKPGSRRLLFK